MNSPSLSAQDLHASGHPQRIFVSEYVCGGAWPDGMPDGSLAAEGRAMLTALVEDLLRVSDIEVITTWDARLGPFPLLDSSRLTVCSVGGTDEEATEFNRRAKQADSAIVIAPETGGVLADRCQSVLDSDCSLIGSTPAAIELCTDKLSPTHVLDAAGITHIPTASLDVIEPVPAWPFPLIVKPRDGAGSQLTFRVDDNATLMNCVSTIRQARSGLSFIQQPFVSGQPASAAAILPNSESVFPAGAQLLTDDGRFQYLGCDLPGPFTCQRQSEINRIIQRCSEAVPGLCGYVGFDLIIPDNDHEMPVLVEINPRLTTGYLAWRQWTDQNLAKRIVRPQVRESQIQWQSQSVQFRIAQSDRS